MTTPNKLAVSFVLALVLLRLTGTGASPLAPAVRGPLRVVIVHETLDTTPQLARLITALRRDGNEVEEYLRTKQHTLDVLDDDHQSVDAAWFAGVRLPAVVLLDANTGQVQGRGELPADRQLPALLAWLKSQGV